MLPQIHAQMNRNATNPKQITANLNPASMIAGANLKIRYATAMNPITSNILVLLAVAD